MSDLLQILVIVTVIGTVSAWFTEGRVWCKSGNTACEARQAEEIRAREEQDHECTTPQLVTTSPDGVKLWSVHKDDCFGKIIFFSSAGTHTTHEECRHSGKTRHCETVDDDVPTGRATP